MIESNLQAVREELGDQFEIFKAVVDEVGDLCPSSIGWVKCAPTTDLPPVTTVYLVAGSAVYIIQGESDPKPAPNDFHKMPAARCDVEMVPLDQKASYSLTVTRAESATGSAAYNRCWIFRFGNHMATIERTDRGMDPVPLVRALTEQIIAMQTARGGD